jgi:hypothetical protein
MYNDALKIGAAAIALGLLAYAGSAGAVPEAVEPLVNCKITDDVLTINGDSNYQWDDHARGRYEPCSRVSLTPTAEEPFTTCYYVAGRRYCK